MWQCVDSPQGFARHLLITDAVVDQRLVPHWVQGVFQGLGTKLVRLHWKEKHTKTHTYKIKFKSGFETNSNERRVVAVL